MDFDENAILRVEETLKLSGLEIEITILDQNTATAVLAAEALNVTVPQIAKSIVVAGKNRIATVLLRGSERVNVESLSARLGEKVKLLVKKEVLRRTGFAVGGVSPVGSLEPVPVLMDEGLFQYEIVWAAAGSPYHVFGCTPDNLQKLTNAEVCHVAI